ncbi:hypothetical protein [Enterovirga sp. CN4-39]|uniref:hypothetical protein n=1 Tax=Enterovirga sp. CN4-39 TaxID=3400910 RepID=UPI003C0C2CCC
MPHDLSVGRFLFSASLLRDPLTATLGVISGIGTIGGSILQAGAARDQAEAAARAQEMEAAALEREAAEKQAAAQRQAITEGRKTDLVLSRTQALAAASGGGATDPTVLDIMGDAAGQGAYNSAAAIYEGAAQARGLEERAELSRFRARESRRAAGPAAAAAILSGITGMADKGLSLRRFR